MRHRISLVHTSIRNSERTEETRRKMEMVCVALVILAGGVCTDSKKGKVNVAVVALIELSLDLLKVRGSKGPP